MNHKTIRAAVIGMGNMGRAHAGNLLRDGGVEIAALCSQPTDDAEKFAKEHDLSCAIYSDGIEMIEKEALDILYVCLPPYAHNGQIEAAARKGIHVFTEKPLALDVARASSMAEAVRSAGVHSQVGYHMRFGGAVKKLKELIDNGTAGRPTLFTGRYECNSLHTPWWIDVTKCGGQVFEQVIHLYDMAMYFMGTPQIVSGFTANLAHRDTPGYTVEDTSISSILFESGALGGISGSNCAVPNQWNGGFRIVCEKLVADFVDFNHMTVTYTAEDDPQLTRTETFAFNCDAMRLEDEYFLRTVRGEAQPFATIADGYLGLQMVAGVVSSSASGGVPVKII